MSSNNNNNNNNIPTTQTSDSPANSNVTCGADSFAKSFFDNLPTDVNERREYIHHFKKSIKLEKRKLKELSGDKKCKKSKDKHAGFEFHHHGFGKHGHGHGHGFGHGHGCRGAHHQEQDQQASGPVFSHAHPFGGYGHHYGGFHAHANHHHQQQQTPGQFEHPHAHSFHHGFGKHGHGHGHGHGHKNVENKICKLSKKKQILIAKAQYIDSKIAILSQKPKEEIAATVQTATTEAPKEQPIGSIVEDFKNL